MLLMGALMLATAPVTDSVQFTRLMVVLDARTWQEIHESAFLPEAFGTGYSASDIEVRLCDRLTCVVMVAPDSAAGRVVGDVRLGVVPRDGSALAAHLKADTGFRVLEIAPVVPPPDFSVPADSLPVMYYLQSAEIALPTEALNRIEPLLKSAGATIYHEGAGLVVKFPSQVIRLVPDYAGAGVKELNWRLRRPLPGNPTYRFASISRLRFGPGRTGTWTFP